MTEILITKAEERAIASLKRLAKKWSETLSLFSNNGSLQIMKEERCMDSILGIENDGGDWTEELYFDDEVELIYE